MIWLTSRNYYHDTFIEQPSSCILIYIKEKRKKNIFSLWLELLGFTLTTFIYKCSSFNYSYHVHYIANAYISYRASLLAQRIKNLPATAGDTEDADLIPWSGRSSAVGNGNLLQYSCLENSTGKIPGAWQDVVHGISKGRTWLSDWACTCVYN